MRLIRDTPQDNGIPEILWNIEGIKPLEPIRAVYFLFLNEQIVYVGQSGNVHLRIQQHIKDREKQFNKVFYQPIPSDVDILAVEKQYILHFRPKYNYETTAKSCERPSTTDELAYYLRQVGNEELRRDQVYLDPAI
jgi:hypothetical protein